MAMKDSEVCTMVGDAMAALFASCWETLVGCLYSGGKWSDFWSAQYVAFHFSCGAASHRHSWNDFAANDDKFCRCSDCNNHDGSQRIVCICNFLYAFPAATLHLHHCAAIRFPCSVLSLSALRIFNLWPQNGSLHDSLDLSFPTLCESCETDMKHFAELDER